MQGLFVSSGVRALSYTRHIGRAPKQTTLGLVKLSFIAVPCIFIGGFMSKSLASFLEGCRSIMEEEDDDF